MRALAARLLPARLPRPSLSMHWRRRLIAALIVVALLASAYWFWFRDSGLVAVDHVKVTGMRGEQAADVRSALEAAGTRMTTLHVDRDALERAVTRFPTVAGIDVEPDFPGALRIQVSERLPAAVLAPARAKAVTVAADGMVLGGASKGLPVVRVRAAVARRVTAPALLRLLAVAGAAPERLRTEISSIGERRGDGIVVGLGAGVPELRFGDPSRVRAKWAAAASLLARPEVAGGSYIDLGLPERPAVGGLGAKPVPLPAGQVAPDQQPAAPTDQQPVAPPQ